MTSSKGAVVLLSGGQDSTTCLAWAIAKVGHEHVFPIGFHYGQRHSIELNCSKEICTKLGVREPRILSANALAELGGAALTDTKVDINVDARGTGNAFAERHGLPSTFVPGRNMLFLTLAAAYGATLGVHDLVTGVCQTDEAGYPDCRESFVTAAENALAAALDEPGLVIHAPLLHLSKAETFLMAEDLNILDVIIENTHTCYRGERQRFDWGYGCGGCGACNERASGYAEYLSLAI